MKIMTNSHKIAVFYYTQTQQLFNILNSLLKPLEEKKCTVVYKEIKPLVPFGFPWTTENFYQAFPECRQEIPCKIEQTDFSDINDADLVVLGYQPWFLSPSLPVTSFLQEEATQNYLKGKKVITVIGSRNMWISSNDCIKRYFDKSGCSWVGNIVLEDRHNNLVSVLTIFRWLIENKKGASKYLPEAGVSQKDIDSMQELAPEIYQSLKSKNYHTLQSRIADKGGVVFHNNLYLIERAGHKMFGFWSKWVLKKGPYLSPQRTFRLKLFKYYLMTVIFVISPFGSIVFDLTYPFRRSSLIKAKKKYVYLHQ